MPKKLPKHRRSTPAKDCRVILRFWEPTGKGHVAPSDSSTVHHGYTKEDALRLFNELDEIMHPTPAHRTQLILEQLQHVTACSPDGACTAQWVSLEEWEWNPDTQEWYRFTKGRWQ